MSIMLGIVCIVAILCITFIITFAIYAIEQYNERVNKRGEKEDANGEYANS